METTAAQINHTMREIFHDHQLVWGVTDRDTNAFVGQVGFAPIDTAKHEATLSVDLTATYQQVTTLREILERLVAFGTVELKLNRLTLILPKRDDLMAQILAGLNFSTTDHLTFNYHQ